jgi:hypothetical protein
MIWFLAYGAGVAVTFFVKPPKKGDPDDWFAARLAVAVLWPVWLLLALVFVLLWGVGKLVTPELMRSARDR